ncbi:MAG: hypothetical protein A2W99_13345 [Bacteroidetes bacterium GWF2_33_16]|nr:MAG: hypothetical protein A2X00_00930 [Bacteroidetes bacterium GWE2_32_14]OFY06663.1 MAG: hypothetical protein A2W99_13345 [Bacteroidetes bacterium GWF2_33_16]
MRKIIYVTFLVFISLQLNAQLENIPLITVTGQAVENILPDEIILRVKITKPLTFAQLQNMRVFNLFDTEDTQVKFIGTNDSEILKSIILVKNSKQIELIKELYIYIHDISKYTDILIKLYNLGFENISIIDIRTTKLDEYKERAYSSAIKNAWNKAAMFAASLGQTIGKAHTIEEIPQPIDNLYKDYLLMPYDTATITYGLYKMPGTIHIPVKVKVSFDLVK